MDKGFKNWAGKEAIPQITGLLGSNIYLSKNIPQENTFKLYSLYLQKKLFDKTKWLVWATWAVAIGTIILLGITIYFQYFKR